MLFNLFSIDAFATSKNNVRNIRVYNSNTGQMETRTQSIGRGGLRAQTNQTRRNNVTRAKASLGGIRPTGRP